MSEPKHALRRVAALVVVLLTGGLLLVPASSASAVVSPCTDGSAPALLSTVTCTVPGSYTLVVPSGTTSVDITGIGGGGGSGTIGGNGGSAGKAIGTATLPTGTSKLYVIVGAGGTMDLDSGENYGGGASAVFALNASSAVLSKLLIAGGGGSAGSGANGGSAGSAGASYGGAVAGSAPVGITGGAAGSSDPYSNQFATAGANYSTTSLSVASGGGGAQDWNMYYAGGDGGGGYAGGGGGGWYEPQYGAGGGGGSSHVDATYIAGSTLSVQSGTGGVYAGGYTPVAGSGGSIVLSIVGPSVPAAPTSVSAEPGNSQASVSFTAPSSNGGSAITGYTVTSSPTGLTATCTTSPCIVTGLTNGTGYTFTVHATNVNGNSAESTASTSVTPALAPGAPTAATATVSNGQASVTFTAPASNGGSTITGYTVTSSPGGLTGTCVTSPCTVTGLTNGTSYTFTVHATNAVGNSAESAASTAVIPLSVPAAPTGVSAAPGTAQAVVSFAAPSNTGGTTITNYTVTSSPGGLTATCPTSPCTVAGLVNGTAYTFTVHATNSVGSSIESPASTAVTPASPPGTPTGAAATVSSGAASVSFTTPVSNGGSIITGYTVTSSPGGFTGTCTTSPCAIAGLINGASYTFTVHATNAIGNSLESAASTAVTPIGTPAAPTVTVTPGNASAAVSVTAPSNTGGSPVISYEYSTDNGTTWHALTTTGSAPATGTITGLTNGVAYAVKVHALNTVGAGAASTVTSVTPATTPGAPTGASAVRGAGQAVVSFLAPVSNGGAAITTYTVTAAPGGVTATCATSPCTVIGLTNGVSYTFTVHATNPVGSSAESAPSIAGAPAPPANVNSRAAATSVTVSFTAPDDGGMPITSYQASTDNGVTWSTLTTTGSGGSRSGTITGLTPATGYPIQLRAINSVGTGIASGLVTVTTLPAAMAAPMAVPGTSSATISWPQSPTTTVTGYTVYAQPGPATCVTLTITDTSCVIGATVGVNYTYTVVANTAAGDSAGSPSSTTVTPAAPEVPAAAPLDAATTLTTTDGILTQVEPSQEITVVGTGFLADSTVTIIIYSTPIVLATVTTDANGAFSQLVTVPATLSVGAHNLVASGVDPNGAIHAIRMAVTVNAAASTSALPKTGAPDLQLTILAGLLTGAGLLLVRLGRRRSLSEI